MIHFISSLEPLESRIAPAYVGVYSGGPDNRILTLSGDNSGHTVQLSTGGTKMLSVTDLKMGTKQDFDLNGLSSLRILGGAIVDEVHLTLEVMLSVPAIDFDGGSAGDRLVLEGQQGTLDLALSKTSAAGVATTQLLANAGSGTLSYSNVSNGLRVVSWANLSVHAQSAGPDDVTLAGSVVRLNYEDKGANLVTFDQVTNLDLRLDFLDEGPIVDHLTVTSFPKAKTRVNAYLGSGDDTLSITSDGNSLIGPVGFFGGEGRNTLEVTTYSNGGLSLSDNVLDLGNSKTYSISLAEFQVANISAAPKSNISVRLPSWSGEVKIVGHGDADALTLQYASGTFSVNDSLLTRSSGGDIHLEGIDSIHLVAGSVLQTSAPVTLDVSLTTVKTSVEVVGGLSKDDRVAVTQDAEEFSVRDGTLTRTGAASIILDRVEKLTLIGGPGANTFEVSGFTGNLSVDGVSGEDRLILATAERVEVTNKSISSNPGNVLYEHLDTVTFTDATREIVYAGSDVEDVSYTEPVLTVQGATPVRYEAQSTESLFSVSHVRSLASATEDFSLAPAANAPGTLALTWYRGDFVYSPGLLFTQVPKVTLKVANTDSTYLEHYVGVDSVDATGLRDLRIETGPGNDTLYLQSAATFTLPVGGGALTFDGGEGLDSVQYYGDLSVDLTGELLALQENGLLHESRGQITLASGSVEKAVIFGLEGDNRYHFAAPKMVAYVDGGGGNDIFDLSGGLAGQINGEPDFATRLMGGEGDDTFIVQSGNGIGGLGSFAAILGGPGRDTLQATGDLNFYLSDTTLVRGYSQPGLYSLANIISLSGLEHVVLTGGLHRNVLDAGEFSGTSDLAGGGRVDNLVASRGGGELHGYSRDPVNAKSAMHYTRDNFFAPDGTLDSLTTIYATKTLGNSLSFRYYQSATETGVNYHLRDGFAADLQQVATGGHQLSIALAEKSGSLSNLEGSAYADTLIGNRQVNVLLGRGGNDVLHAQGADFLAGGVGHDRLLGLLALKNANREFELAGSLAALRPIYDPAAMPNPAEVIARLAGVVGGAAYAR